MIRELTNSELAPGVIDRDHKSMSPKNQIRKVGKLGLMGMIVPKKWGGSNYNTIQYVSVIEEIASEELATSTIMFVKNSLVCQVLIDWGNDNQKNNQESLTEHSNVEIKK